MKYLLDTNIICESTKTKPDPNVAVFLREVAISNLYICVLSIGEIRKGIERLKQKQEKKLKLQFWLDNELCNFFSGRILSINLAVAEKWGFLLGAIPQPMPAIDSLIAATAICHNLVLVTRNVQDFTKYPLEIMNPFLREPA